MEIPLQNGKYTQSREGRSVGRSNNRFFINKEREEEFDNSRVSRQAIYFLIVFHYFWKQVRWIGDHPLFGFVKDGWQLKSAIESLKKLGGNNDAI